MMAIKQNYEDRSDYERQALMSFFDRLGEERESSRRDRRFNTAINFALLVVSVYLLQDVLNSKMTIGTLPRTIIFVILTILIPALSVMYNYFWLFVSRQEMRRQSLLEWEMLNLEREMIGDSALYSHWVERQRLEMGSPVFSLSYRYIVAMFMAAHLLIISAAVFSLSPF